VLHVEIVINRFLEKVYKLCLRKNLQVARGMTTVSLSRMISAVVPCLASSSAMQLLSGTQMTLIFR